jgi:hypothetical protein
MFRPSKLLDAVQVEWPLLPSIAMIGITETLPHWATSSAQRALTGLQPGDLAACRAKLPSHAEMLAALHRRWVVAAVLAILLALAVVASAHAMPTPMDEVHLGVLIGVLGAILLPPLAICNGIARDYVAARALVAAMAGVVKPIK